MHDALVLFGRPVAELKVLAAIAHRRPADKDAQNALHKRQLALGLLLDRVTTDAEAFPAPPASPPSAGCRTIPTSTLATG